MSKKLKLDLVSLFSHELKTPLSSLKIAVELLKEDPSQKDILNLMEDELNKMISFIQNHLDTSISKQKKNFYNLKWEPWDETIQRVALSFSLILKKHQIHLKIDHNSFSNLEVFMDSVWLEQLLKNLISNAIKESPKNGTIYLSYKIIENDQLEVSVRDEGKGLFSSKEDFIKPQSQKSSFGELRNTGLGLIISQEIAQAHGAELKVKLSNKRGGFFLFSLPQIRKLQKSA